MQGCAQNSTKREREREREKSMIQRRTENVGETFALYLLIYLLTPFVYIAHVGKLGRKKGFLSYLKSFRGIKIAEY